MDRGEYVGPGIMCALILGGVVPKNVGRGGALERAVLAYYGAGWGRLVSALGWLGVWRRGDEGDRGGVCSVSGEGEGWRGKGRGKRPWGGGKERVRGEGGGGRWMGGRWGEAGGGEGWL